MSDATGALQASLAELERRRRALEAAIRSRVSRDLQAWRHQVERRPHPEGYVTIDRRWSSPSMRAAWMTRALADAERRFTQQRHAEVASELKRLEGKIARLKKMVPDAHDSAAAASLPGSSDSTLAPPPPAPVDSTLTWDRPGS